MHFAALSEASAPIASNPRTTQAIATMMGCFDQLTAARFPAGNAARIIAL